MSLKIGDRIEIINEEGCRKEHRGKKAVIVNKYISFSDGFCIMFDEEIGHDNYKGKSLGSHYKEEEDHLYKKGNYYFWYYDERNVKKLSKEIKVFEDD